MTVPAEPADIEPAEPPLPAQPYPGLRPFTAAEWPLFFGRESMTQDVVARVVEKQFVAVHGDSGCGKSSLIAAGVMPFLEHDQARAGGNWTTTTMRPEESPIANLARALAGEEGLSNPARILDIRRLLNRGVDAPVAVARYLNCDAEHNVCILFDQFEELFEHAKRGGATEAGLVTDFLVGLTAKKPQGLHAILTMRSDYLGNCAQYKGFAETVNETQYLVPRMERPALMRCIREPAALFGGSVDMELAGKLIADAGVGQDQLPLIQHGLMLMWRRKAGEGGVAHLTMEDYRAEGDLASQLSGHADDILQQAIASPAEEAVVEDVFRALTDRNSEGLAIRRRQRFADLCAVTGASRDTLARIIDRFRAPDASFLRPYGEAPLRDDDVIDISHEAFIRNWKRISEPGSGWLDREADDGLIWTSLRIAAAIFEKNPEALLSPAVAEERAKWLESHNEAWAARYKDQWEPVSRLISESRAAIQLAREHKASRRRRIIFSGMAALSTIFLGLAAFALWQTYQASQLANAAMLSANEANLQRQEALKQREDANAQREEALKQQELAKAAQAEAERQAGLAKAAQFEAESLRQKAMDSANEAQKSAVEAMASAAQAQQYAQEAAAQAKDAIRNETSGIAAISGLAYFESGPVEAVKLALAAWPRQYDERPPLRATLDRLSRALPDLHESLRVPQDGLINYAVFSPDGRHFATASGDKSARVFDARSGKELLTLVGHEQFVLWIGFSPDGTRVVTSSGDKTVRVWDTATGAELMRMTGHENTVNFAEYSPDGRTIATASNDKTARLWDAATGAEIRQFTGHEGEVLSAEFSADGRRIVTASWDKTARIWDVASGAQIGILNGHEGKVYSAMFSPDGKRIVTSANDNTARIWDTATQQQTLLLAGHTNAVNWAAFSPDGTGIVTASWDNTARLWDAASGRQTLVLKGHTSTVWSAGYSGDGQTVITASSDKTVRMWRVAGKGQIAALTGHEGAVVSARFSPDGRHVATSSLDKTAKIWDAATGALELTLSGHTDTVFWVSYSQDGKRIATASRDRTARVWDALTGTELKQFTGHQDTVWTAEFSPDGRQLITSSTDKTARVWDVASGRQLHVLSDHADQVVSGEFSPDGRTILTGSVDKTARLWNAATGAAIQTLEGHNNTVNLATFSHDGKRIITASWDRTVRIWDAQTGETTMVMDGFDNPVWSATESPDGTRIVTASSPDGERDPTSTQERNAEDVRVWDAETGVKLMTVIGTRNQSRLAYFSPDGRSIVIALADKVALVRDVSGLPSGDAFKVACEELVGNTSLDDVTATYRLTRLKPICGPDSMPVPIDKVGPLADQQ